VHLQKIHEAYPKDAVQVVFAISAAADYVRTSYFPSFTQDLKVGYTGLDDARNDVVRLYGLNADSRTAKNIIVDRDGTVRLVGEFTPRERMETVLDTLLGKKDDVDLATSAAALSALAGGGEYARWRAARALGAMGDRAAVAPLIAALGDSSGSVRECAADALGALGDASAGDALTARLGDASAAVRRAAIAALGKLAHAPAAEKLRAALNDQDASIRAAAAAALGALGDKASGDALLAALKDQSSDVRMHAVAALGALGDARVIPNLVDLLAARAFMRKAAEALVALDQADAVDRAVAAKWSGGTDAARRNLSQIYLALGSASLQAKAHDQGIAWCEKALPAGGSERSLRMCLGDLYAGKGETGKALEQYDRLNAAWLKDVKNGSASAMVCNELAWFYVQKNVRPAESVALAKKAVELDPENANIRDTLGWAYVRSNDADNALATFARVFEGNASFESSWEGVAELARSPAARGKVAKFLSDMEARFPDNEQVKSRTAEIRAAPAG